MTAPFHPLLICLMRELAEADEAKQSTGGAIGNALRPDNHRGVYFEYWARATVYDFVKDDLIAHLLLMPHAALDTAAYERLWAESRVLPEDERENGKLWDAVEDVAAQAIELYRRMK